MNRLWLAQRHLPHKGYHHPPHKCHRHLLCKGTVLKLTTVQFVNRLGPLNKWPIYERVYSNYCNRVQLSCLCLVHQQHRLATNSPVLEWDIVAPHFFHQHGELSLACSTGEASNALTAVHLQGQGHNKDDEHSHSFGKLR